MKTITETKTRTGGFIRPPGEAKCFLPPAPNIRRETTAEQICVLTFDRPDSSANVFDRATLLELDKHLDYVAQHPELRGVIITSAKPNIFIAGADLPTLAKHSNPAVPVAAPELVELIELGQRTFTKLAALPVPKVTAIHGACVGGGFELCLACDYRIASPERVTKIGLPETKLGLLPAWGGSTRLPRLIGLPAALDIILAGKTPAAVPARKLGLVDELAPREYLVSLATRRILKLGAKLMQRRRNWSVTLANHALPAFLIDARLQAQLQRTTRGHYPAVFKALQVIVRGITRPVAESLELERDGILELARSEACHHLLHLFLQQEHAKKFTITAGSRGKPEKAPEETGTHAAVIGAGVMGSGIAQWLSAHDVPVTLRDTEVGRVANGMANIRKLYRDGVRRHAFTPLEARHGLDRIFPTHTATPLDTVDLVIEAAVEKMELKQQIFRQLAEQTDPHVILATNTSALSVSEIASATRAPERVVGLHFFNPVHRMPLVEIVAGRKTSASVLERTIRFTQQIGKLPVVVKDSPGFLVNRILMPYLVEAGRLFEAGAHIRDIDEAMLDFGMPMGPLRLIDEVGVDVSAHVARTLADAFGERLAVPHVLEELLKSGLLGRKNERGFYLHEGQKAVPNDGLGVFQTGHYAEAYDSETLQQRMTLLMINEAARCLEEHVVDTADDVDFAMVMGTGFAPFRGGPLRYADSLGLDDVVGAMRQLVETGFAHFTPCDLLRQMAARNETFYHSPEEHHEHTA